MVAVPLGSLAHLSHGCLVLIPFCVCSLNVNRFSPANYDQAHLHPHLFSDQSRGSPSSYSPSAGVGLPPTQALKVPPLDQFPTFPPSAHQQPPHYTASALQQALLSPTPPDYARHQQVPHILQGLLSPRHSLTGHSDIRLPPAEFAQLIKRQQRQQQQQQQQEYQELFRHMNQGDAGSLAPGLGGQSMTERQALPYQNADSYHHHHTSPQHLLQIRAQECISQVSSPTPTHGYAHQPALVHSESMEEECSCEGAKDGFPDRKNVNTLTKGCHDGPLLLSTGGPGDPESLLGTVSHVQELGIHPYRQPAAAFNRNKVSSRGKSPAKASPGPVCPHSVSSAVLPFFSWYSGFLRKKEFLRSPAAPFRGEARRKWGSGGEGDLF